MRLKAVFRAIGVAINYSFISIFSQTGLTEMDDKRLIHKHLLKALPVVALAAAVFGAPGESSAQMDMSQKPVLVITNKAMPVSTPSPSTIYTGPVRAPEITPEQVTSNAAFFDGSGTVVGRKIDELNKDIMGLQSIIFRLAEKLNTIEAEGRTLAAGYYASVATINTQLQSGSTPGNPRLVGKLDTAQNNLEMLSDNVADLNGLAVEAADAASRGSFLLDSIRTTYTLSGAIEEDHQRLAVLEDRLNNLMFGIDKVLNEVNDDISRMNTYLTTERNNLRTLGLAVSNGDLYGRNLANHPFSQVPMTDLMQQTAVNGGGAMMPPPGMAPTPIFPGAPEIAPMGGMAMAPPPAPAPAMEQPRPLAKIRFDKPNVDYEQPIYTAVQEARERYPNARFELIAVHPTTGNAAQQAIESTRARRSAEKVLRTLTQFGIPLEQIDMSYAPNPEAQSSEVHLFLRS
jgi:hypothetical protein